MKNFDVAALGELLVDFTQYGISEQGSTLFEANPGGAPANVLAMLRKLGRRCAFIGKVGADAFGDMLAKVVSDTGTDISGLLRDREVHTTLAIVQTFSNGDRDFSFYRKPGADLDLRAEELPEDILRSCRIFHFGTLSLTGEPCRSATVRAWEIAKEAGALISFDPNWRAPLWDDAEEGKAMIRWGLERCDILKISDNEVELMTGQSDYVAGGRMLKEAWPNIRLLNVTAGSHGSYSFYEDGCVFVPACRLGGVIETTGAGDTFCANVLNFVLERGLDGLTEEELKAMLTFANTAAYIVTTRKGAIRAMPEREEVESLLCRLK